MNICKNQLQNGSITLTNEIHSRLIRMKTVHFTLKSITELRDLNDLDLDSNFLLDQDSRPKPRY